MLMAASKRRQIRRMTEGMPIPAGCRDPIGIDRPSIRQYRNTLWLFRVGVSGLLRRKGRESRA
ncbi:hypothetical protein X748_02285 [Mesorhizobium sp. LNJC386A00]|nr:hypothetical protein X748_02285 [Mesorhizobium sp. LNJC386A00]